MIVDLGTRIKLNVQCFLNPPTAGLLDQCQILMDRSITYTLQCLTVID